MDPYTLRCLAHAEGFDELAAAGCARPAARDAPIDRLGKQLDALLEPRNDKKRGPPAAPAEQPPRRGDRRGAIVTALMKALPTFELKVKALEILPVRKLSSSDEVGVRAILDDAALNEEEKVDFLRLLFRHG